MRKKYDFLDFLCLEKNCQDIGHGSFFMHVILMNLIFYLIQRPDVASFLPYEMQRSIENACISLFSYDILLESKHSYVQVGLIILI